MVSDLQVEAPEGVSQSEKYENKEESNITISNYLLRKEL